MTPMQILFLLVGALSLFGAVMVVSARRVMHSALWLVFVLFDMAVLFAMLESGFFAVVQVMVYVGAIAILIVFAVMLTRKVMLDTGPQVVKGWWLPAVLMALLFGGVVAVFSTWDKFSAARPELSPEAYSIAEFGKLLVSPDGFMIPFEVASLLLLAALVGAVFVASDRKGKNL